MEVNSFVHLKLFPREKNGAIDEGKQIMPFSEWENFECPKCKQHSMTESVSLEYCGRCGYVETDYWGLIPKKEKYI